MSAEKTLVHITHEAVGKIGGIGAVLEGFFTSSAYLDAVKRTSLVCPLFSRLWHSCFLGYSQRCCVSPFPFNVSPQSPAPL